MYPLVVGFPLPYPYLISFQNYWGSMEGLSFFGFIYDYDPCAGCGFGVQQWEGRRREGEGEVGGRNIRRREIRR